MEWRPKTAQDILDDLHRIVNEIRNGKTGCDPFAVEVIFLDEGKRVSVLGIKNHGTLIRLVQKNTG